MGIFFHRTCHFSNTLALMVYQARMRHIFQKIKYKRSINHLRAWMIQNYQNFYWLPLAELSLEVQKAFLNYGFKVYSDARWCSFFRKYYCRPSVIFVRQNLIASWWLFGSQTTFYLFYSRAKHGRNEGKEKVIISTEIKANEMGLASDVTFRRRWKEQVRRLRCYKLGMF